MVLPYRLSGKLKFNWSVAILICVALTAENVTSGRFMLTVPPNKPAGMPSALPSVFTPLGLVSIWMLLPSLLRITKAPSVAMLANTPVMACWPLMALISDCLLAKGAEPMACPLMAKLAAKKTCLSGIRISLLAVMVKPVLASFSHWATSLACSLASDGVRAPKDTPLSTNAPAG